MFDSAFHRKGGFLRQTGIAELERLGRVVRTLGEEFDRAWRALGARDIDEQRCVRERLVYRADGKAQRRETAIEGAERVGVALYAGPLDACRALDAELIGDLEFLENVSPDTLGFRRMKIIRFRAADREVAIVIL